MEKDLFNLEDLRLLKELVYNELTNNSDLEKNPYKNKNNQSKRNVLESLFFKFTVLIEQKKIFKIILKNK